MDLAIFPDGALRRRCAPAGPVTDEIRAELRAMAEKMALWGGIGLAAPQCGIDRRMFVAVVPGGTMAFVDPVVDDMMEGDCSFREGCLSIPGVTVDVVRPASVLVRAFGADGAPFQAKCRGLLARCVQHEADHLDGVLMIDRIGPLEYRFALQDAWDERVRRGR